jgi:hypothetical protein
LPPFTPIVLPVGDEASLCLRACQPCSSYTNDLALRLGIAQKSRRADERESGATAEALLGRSL